MDIPTPHPPGTLKETCSFSYLQLPPVYSFYTAAERLLLSSLAPLPAPHQSLPGGAASTTPPADFQTVKIPLQVANLQLPPCIWLAELRSTCSETWPGPPLGRSHKPSLHSHLCCRHPSFYSFTPLNSLLQRGRLISTLAVFGTDSSRVPGYPAPVGCRDYSRRGAQPAPTHPGSPSPRFPARGYAVSL
jgi:hypothetical protein